MASAGYAGLTLLALWQALRGQALTSPDGLALAVLGVLLVLVAAVVVIGTGRRAPERAREPAA